MPIDFPASPTTGQTYTYNGVLYTYTAQGMWTSAGGNNSNIRVVMQKFTASGVYTPTSGMQSVIIECVGAGGGGAGVQGGTSTQVYQGGGGGSGGYSRSVLTAAQIGGSQPVTVGLGGFGANSSQPTGGTGGDTSVGGLCIAKGGIGGTWVQSGVQTPAGGFGGVAGTGDFTAAGNDGGMGQYNPTVGNVYSFCGNGAPSVFGGGRSSNLTSNPIGVTAVSPGAGGSGGITNQVALANGGAGAPGVVIITEFIAVALSGAGLPAAPFDAMAYSGMQYNGSMEVSQENGTTAIPASGYVVDGWTSSPGAGTFASAQQVADAPPGFANSIKQTIQTAVAGGILCFVQRIEGYRFARMAFGTANAQPVTLCFWCKVHRPGLYSGAMRNNGSVRSYVFTFTMNAADTWEYKTVTIPGDTGGTWLTTNGNGVQLTFTAGSDPSHQTAVINTWQNGFFYGATGVVDGSSSTTDTFQITGVIVLPGIQAPTAAQSPLIMRSYDHELEICKRYLQFSYVVMDGPASAGVGATAGASVTFSPQMRGTPSIAVNTIDATANIYVGQPSVPFLSPLAFAAQITAVGAARFYWYGSLKCDARL